MCSAFFGGVGNSFINAFRLYCRYNKQEGARQNGTEKEPLRSDPPQPPHAGQRGQRGGGQDLGDGGALLKAAAQSKPTEEQWQTMLDAARLLTEINDLDDMVLTAKAPSGGFLNIQELRSLLGIVQEAIHAKRQEGRIAPL